MLQPNNTLTGSPGTTLSLAISAADAAVAVQGGVKYRVVANSDCFIAINTPATITSCPLFAKVPEIFVFVPVGGTVQLHAIMAAGTGTLFLTPLVDGVGANT